MTGRPCWKPGFDFGDLHPRCANCGYPLWRHDYDLGNYWCPGDDDSAMIPVPDHPPLIGQRAAGPVPPTGPAISSQRGTRRQRWDAEDAGLSARQAGVLPLLIGAAP
jgi:hypothetical protein